MGIAYWLNVYLYDEQRNQFKLAGFVLRILHVTPEQATKQLSTTFKVFTFELLVKAFLFFKTAVENVEG